MYKDNLPVYNIVIDENDPEYGIHIMSIVDEPAVEKNFMMFGRQKPHTMKFTLNEEKRIVSGVALRCNYPIYRYDPDSGKEYYVVFDAQTIEKAMHKFMREMHIKDVNVQHGMDVEGVYLVESFIINQNHRLCYEQFSDIEEGSWFVSYKVDNDVLWQSIKAGKLRGFSVEIASGLRPGGYHNIKELYNLVNLIEHYDSIAKS